MKVRFSDLYNCIFARITANCKSEINIINENYKMFALHLHADYVVHIVAKIQFLPIYNMLIIASYA